MRGLCAISGAAMVLGCGSAPEVAGGDVEPVATMTDVRVGGCAPVRYREPTVETGKPKPPAKPRIKVTFQVPSYPGAALTRELEAIKPRLTACFGADEIGENARVRISVSFYMNGSGQVMRVRARGASKARCVESAVRSRVRQLPASPRRRSSAYATLLFSRGKTAPPPKPERIVLVEGRDRVVTSLAVAAAVSERRDGLQRCVRAAGLLEPGQLAPTVELEKGRVASVEVSAVAKLEACVEKSLSTMELGGEAGGVFQCAVSAGVDRAAAPAFATTISAAAIAVGGSRIDAALIREQRPPAGPLYEQLAARRFAADGGETTSLRIEDDATGDLIIRATEAAAAADLDLGAIEIRRGGAWVAVAELSDMERPRLPSTAGQAAGPVVVVTSSHLWAGAALDKLAVELETSALAALERHLSSMRSKPGLAHRRDVVVGVGGDVTGAVAGAVIERIGAAGFDQLELVSASAARARLAR